jgi:DNA polymerase I-like protein with 3'-5' exonuclease and polymerase domains
MIEPGNHWEHKIIFVTNHLGSDDIGNTPFSGRGAALLHNNIRRAGLHPGDFEYKVLIPSRISPARFNWMYEHKNSDTALEVRYEWIKSEILEKPNKIIFTDSQYFLERVLRRSSKEVTLKHYHSTVIEWNGRWVIPTIECRELYGANFIGNYTFLRDLNKLRVIYKSRDWDMDRTRRKYNYNPSLNEVREFFDMIREIKLYSMDIETTMIPERPKKMDFHDYVPLAHEWRKYKHVTSMSFSIDEDFSLIIPFETLLLEGTAEEYALYWEEVVQLFGDPSITVIIQNMIHELVVLFKLHWIEIKNKVHDTMIMHSLLYPELEKSLEYLAASYTFLPYFKQDGKKYFLTQEAHGLELLYSYNGTDSCATMEVFNILFKEIQDERFYKIYMETIEYCYVLFYMETFGFNYDKKSNRDIGEMKEAQIHAYNAAFLWMVDGHSINIRELISPEGSEVLDTVDQYKEWYENKLKILGPPKSDININSTQQLCKYIYEGKKITPYKAMKKDKYKNITSVNTLNDKALQKLSRATVTRKAVPEASIIQKYRKAKKLDSTYVKILLDVDDRFRAGWNPRGSGFSRLSSTKTIDGVGGNLQNQAPFTKKSFIPDPGYILYEFDLAQAEWVVTGFEAPEPEMIKVFMRGDDAHVNTIHLITKLPKELIIKETKILKKDPGLETMEEVRDELCKEFNVKKVAHFFPRTMTLRQMGKKANHELDYDITYTHFSEENEIPMSESRYIHTMYFQVYPNLRKYYKRIQSDINSKRMLDNCFGRHNRFLNRINDQYFKAGYSYKPQSTVGDVIRVALTNLYRTANVNKLYPIEFWKDTHILANVHDSIVIERKNNGYLDAFKFSMEMRSLLHVPLKAHGRTYHLNADAKISHSNWGTMEELKLEDHNKYLDELRKFFEKNNL